MTTFVPERLIEARHVRGAQPVEVARDLQVGINVYRAWENGSYQPSEGQVAALGLLLDFPMRWFTKPYEHSIDPRTYNSLRDHLKLNEADFCVICHGPAEYLCDQRGDEGQFVCSAPMCALDVQFIGENDYCRTHIAWRR